MRTSLLLLLLCIGSARAQFTEFYMQPNGGATNSGHTLDATPTFARQNGNWDNTTGVFICIGAGTNDLSGVTNGAWASVYVDGGTAVVFIGRVTAVDDTLDTITVSKLAFAGTGPGTSATARSIVIGGAWTAPNGTATDAPFTLLRTETQNAAGHRCCLNIKSNNYTLTGNIACNSPFRIEGYYQNPHDNLGRPVFTTGAGASFIMFTTASQEFFNIELDCSNFTSGNSAGFSATRSIYQRCVVKKARGQGFAATGGFMVCIGCEAYLCLADGFLCSGGEGATMVNCTSHHNTEDGFSTTGIGVTMVNCLSYSNLLNGFAPIAGVSSTTLVNCDAWNNGLSGYNYAVGPVNAVNCNALRNGTNGWLPTSFGLYNTINCGRGTGSQTNTSGTFNAALGYLISDYLPVTYASNVTPWRDPTNANFSVSLGAAIGTGWGFFMQSTNTTSNLTIGYPDLGAAQSNATNGVAVPVGSSFTFGP